jgi:hypothetical protein
MRQNPVGEPTATAALNFGTPRPRSSLKRSGPFCHCRQRYRRSLRRIHASRLLSTRGVWQKPKYPRHPKIVERVAREFVDWHGLDALPILREPAEIADDLGNDLAAKAWRDIAAAENPLACH